MWVIIRAGVQMCHWGGQGGNECERYLNSIYCDVTNDLSVVICENDLTFLGGGFIFILIIFFFCGFLNTICVGGGCCMELNNLLDEHHHEKSFLKRIKKEEVRNNSNEFETHLIQNEN